MMELQRTLSCVALPQLLGRTPPKLGERLACSVLLLIMEGFLLLLAPPERGQDAARIAEGEACRVAPYRSWVWTWASGPTRPCTNLTNPTDPTHPTHLTRRRAAMMFCFLDGCPE
jgi:hypothetical protein